MIDMTKNNANGSAIRKASSTSFLMVAFFVVSLMVFGSFSVGSHIWSMKESVDIYNRYYTTQLDKEIQSIKQGFMKTTAFHSLHNTYGHLTAHGNVPEEDMVDLNADGYADGTTPRLLVDRSATPTAFWARTGCQQMKLRLPYLESKDPNLLVGNMTHHPLWNTGGKYNFYINELQTNVYDWHMIINVLMIKKGSLEIKFGPGITIAPAASTITQDGTYVYVISDIDPVLLTNPNFPIEIKFLGLNETDGVDYVAEVNHITVTIYDNNVANAQNNKFSQYLNIYRTALVNDILVPRNADPENEITTTVEPLRGIYTPSTFVKGNAWSENDGIVVSVKDKLGNPDDVLAVLKSSGLIEEEVKFRHRELNDAGEYFILNIGALNIKSEIFDELKLLDDYDSDSFTNGCGNGPSCPNDATDSYIEADFIALIQRALDDVEPGLNALYNPQGIEWELVAPSSIRMDCAGGRTNHNHGSGAPEDECTGGDNVDMGSPFGAYLSYQEEISSSCSKAGCSVPCDCGDDNCETFYEVTCDMVYAHRYILKNIRILVKIKDLDYKYYDDSTNQWENPVLQFYIMIDKLEDNECNGNPCSDVKTTQAAGSECS